MDDWDEIELGMHKGASSLDGHLGARLSNDSVQLLTDRMRDLRGLELPVVAGTKVAFVDNLGALLTYPEPPVGGELGTVVTVRTAAGNATHHNGLVFVKWDDGKFLPVHREHLRVASGDPEAGYVVRVASLNDLTDFLKTSKDELIHKATKDLWNVSLVDGEYVIERLFDETGSPLKV